MATRTVVCPDCDEPLTYGRLSCTNCGALLASVAGAPRRAVPLRSVLLDEPTWLSDDNDLSWLVEDGSLTDDAVSEPEEVGPHAEHLLGVQAETPMWREPAGMDAPEPEALAEPEPEPETPTQPDVLNAPEATADGPESEPVPEPEMSPDVEPPSEPADEAVLDAEPAASPEVDDAEPAAAGEETVAAPAPADVDDAAEPPPPDLTPARAQQVRWLDDRPVVPREPVLRPSYAGRSRLDLTALPPAGDAGDVAATWAAPASEAPDPVTPPPPVAAQPTAPPRPRPGEASRLADLPFDAPRDAVGWLLVAGTALATFGFLLPWSNVIPFSAALGGYTDRWGLAVASHGLVLIGSVVLLGLATLPNRMPLWIRNGIVPLGFGGLLLGLVWPYVLGGLGSHVGSTAVAVAGVLLIVTGILGVRELRHPVTGPRV